MAPKVYELIPEGLWDSDSVPSTERPRLRDLLSQIADVLDSLGFSGSLSSLKDDALHRGIHIDVERFRHYSDALGSDSARLVDMWLHRMLSASHPTSYIMSDSGSSSDESSDSGAELDDSESVGASNNSGKSEDSDDSDSSEDSSDSDTDVETTGKATVEKENAKCSSEGDSDSSSESNPDESAKVGMKRKRVHTPSSSSADKTSTSESTSDAMSDGSSSSGGDASEESNSRPSKMPRVANRDDVSKSASLTAVSPQPDSTSSSGDDSDLQSDMCSDSESDKQSENESSSGSGDSDSRSSPSLSITESKGTGEKSHLFGSRDKSHLKSPASDSSSQTLGADSPVPIWESKAVETDALLVPAAATGHDKAKRLPATKDNIRKLKAAQVPFSRVPTNQKVDPRFSSNAYVADDYGSRAYQDLSVTKGKGFTKEKNKKKRGRPSLSPQYPGREENKREPTRFLNDSRPKPFPRCGG